jgi:secondary thiamine-phosphate synthase enzyme
MLYEYKIKTDKQNFYNITAQVREAVSKSGVTGGICVVYCPHTTAAITINENADHDVVHDILIGLDKAFPDRAEFRHSEGNSSAHLKASAVGTSVTVIVEDSKLVLGTWQGIFFCEFDPGRMASRRVMEGADGSTAPRSADQPPRNRTFYVKVMGD